MNETGLNQLAKEIHESAIAHGWWEEERELPEILMLCVSELSEALEEFRDGHAEDEIRFDCIAPEGAFGESEFDARCSGECNECGYGKPEGVPVELADCIIRILDFCGHAGIDIEEAIDIKRGYNTGRPYRHGGKRC